MSMTLNGLKAAQKYRPHERLALVSKILDLITEFVIVPELDSPAKNKKMCR